MSKQYYLLVHQTRKETLSFVSNMTCYHHWPGYWQSFLVWLRKDYHILTRSWMHAVDKIYFVFLPWHLPLAQVSDIKRTPNVHLDGLIVLTRIPIALKVKCEQFHRQLLLNSVSYVSQSVNCPSASHISDCSPPIPSIISINCSFYSQRVWNWFIYCWKETGTFTSGQQIGRYLQWWNYAWIFRVGIGPYCLNNYWLRINNQ